MYETSARHTHTPFGDAHPAPHERFGRFARYAASAAGKPITFLVATATVIVWAVLGPLFDFSDTWQLVVNTGTTIVTFLMVFLIQNTQNRDTLAIQVKLSELVLAMRGAQNRLALADEMSDEELAWLHEQCRQRADAAMDSINARRKVESKQRSAAQNDDPA